VSNDQRFAQMREALEKLAAHDAKLAKPAATFKPQRRSVFTPGSNTPTDPAWAEMNTTEEMIDFMFGAATANLAALSGWEVTFVDSAKNQHNRKMAAGFKATNTLSGRQLVVLYRIVQKLASTTVKAMTNEDQ